MDEETLVTGTDDKNHGDLDNLDLYMNGPSNHATSSQADWPYDYFRFYFGPAPDWLVEHWASQYLLGAGDLPADMCSTPGAATQYSSSTVTVPRGLTGTRKPVGDPVGLLCGLLTPDPLRGVIIGKLPVIKRLMAT